MTRRDDDPERGEVSRDPLRPAETEPGLTAPYDRERSSHVADHELVLAARRGERAAHVELGERLRYVARVLDARNRRLGSPLKDHELEDVVQDAITRIWEGLAHFEGRSSLESWLYPAALRTFSNALRDRRTRGQWFPRDADTEPDELSAKARESELDAEAIARALQRIEPERAAAIRMRHVAEASFDEIGARLGVPESTAKSWYYRGLSRLQQLLDDLGGLGGKR